jgi:release factor glutamine methyltransferase
MPSTANTTVAQALQEAQASGLARLDAQLLLLFAMGKASYDRSWLVAHDDALLSHDAIATYARLTMERARGIPVAYLVGNKEFFGLQLAVSPAVLIPRPDTETLVTWASEIMATRDADEPAGQLIDLGTGSGAIALALKAHFPGWNVTATDASQPALDQAMRNGATLGLQVSWCLSDWFRNLTASRYDLIVSNPPYIPENDPHLEALAFEPRPALTSGHDGLDDIRLIVTHSPSHLRAGGWLLIEHGYDQGPAVAALLADAGFESVMQRADLAGVTRCTGARWGGP